MSRYKDTFDINIGRVNTLCILYETLQNLGVAEQSGNRLTDILRAAVVLLHSSFEEYFRNVLYELLPKNGEESDFKNISFVGSEGKRENKISIGQLIKHRSKTVDEVIQESIAETLSFTSFNDFSDICGWAEKAKINISSFSKQSTLNKIINRRHKIVHEADNSKSEPEFMLTPIKVKTVMEWIDVVRELVTIIDTQI